MPSLKRFAPLLVIVAAAVTAYATGLTRCLSLDSLRTHEAMLRDLVASHPIGAVAAYVTTYALITGTGIPAALMLTLAGGLLFGPLVGGGATLVGGTLGATITYAAMRSAFGRPLRRRAEQSDGRLRQLIEGFGQNAFAYILSLRLIPMAPFPLVNMAAGIADAPLRPYVLATLVGGVPTSFLFASIGSGLGRAFADGQAPGLSVLGQPYILAPMLGLAALALLSVYASRRRGARLQPSPPDSRVASSPK